jgi:uncharacterized protein YebE (UPF0316 family)
MPLANIIDFFSHDNDIFRLVVLPLLIFFARIADVSINTLRVIYMLNGRRLISTMLGFFESLIWLLAISQILQNLDSWVSYLAYAGGFASGIYVGMRIEDRLAIGNVIVRIITQKDAARLVAQFREHKFRLTVVDAIGNFGPVNILFLIVRRQELEAVTAIVDKTNPQAVLTVEGVKSVKYLTEIVPDPKPERYSFFKYLKRK